VWLGILDGDHAFRLSPVSYQHVPLNQVILGSYRNAKPPQKPPINIEQYGWGKNNYLGKIVGYFIIPVVIIGQLYFTHDDVYELKEISIVSLTFLVVLFCLESQVPNLNVMCCTILILKLSDLLLY